MLIGTVATGSIATIAGIDRLQPKNLTIPLVKFLPQFVNTHRKLMEQTFF
jgi:hypothetical protein